MESWWIPREILGWVNAFLEEERSPPSHLEVCRKVSKILFFGDTFLGPLTSSEDSPNLSLHLYSGDNDKTFLTGLLEHITHLEESLCITRMMCLCISSGTGEGIILRTKLTSLCGSLPNTENILLFNQWNTGHFLLSFQLSSKPRKTVTHAFIFYSTHNLVLALSAHQLLLAG